ncbi:MAG: SH3 domain-containing protein, partial [Acidimicrobiia bacterium]|nr:SH3 domain-containing protein [Acidimicrobiia bacterium]
MTTPDNDGRSYVAVAAAVAFLLAAGWFAVKALGGPTTVAVGPSASVPAATPVTTTSSSTTFASSTSVATTSTAEPSTSTTSSTTDPTVESTTTTTVGPDTTTNIGWYVVGVAPGDVLNVRAAPTVNAEIVGILRPNQDEVTVLAMASNPVGGTAWYGVQLPSGTDGFVNSRYLAHPNQWDAGIKASPCTAQTATATATASTPATGDATAIVGLFQFQTATCDRYVIVLGTSDGTTFEAGEVLGGGDVVVTSGKTRVSVSLPATIVDVVPQATNADFKQALA